MGIVKRVPMAPNQTRSQRSGNRSIQRLQAKSEDQRRPADQRCLVVIHADGQLEELLHVGGVRIERRGAARRETHDNQDFARIVKQLPERALATTSVRFDKRIGLVQVAAHHQCRDRQQRPDHERYPPAPCSQLSGSQQ